MFRKSLSLFLTLWLCALPAIATGYYQASISAGAIVGIVPVANGGTGMATPGTSGNVLTSNGSAWVSSAPTTPASAFTRTLKEWLFDATTAVGFTKYGTSISPTLNGTPTAAPGANGHLVSCASVNVTNSDAGAYCIIADTTQLALAPQLGTKIKTGSSLAVCRLWVGFSSSTATGTATHDVPTTDSVAAFRYAPATDGTAFWRCVTCDGASNVTTVVTTAPIAVNTAYRLAVDTATSGHVLFSIDGTQVADISTNLPATSTSIDWMSNIRTLENVAKTLLIGPVQLTEL